MARRSDETRDEKRREAGPRRSRSSEQAVFSPWPRYMEADIGAAAAVLRSGKVNYWTGGEGRLFEADYARATDTTHAVAVANGTVALELALHAFGIGPGDEVITTPRTFIASASAVVMRGAVPVLADVDRNSQNLTAATVAPLITPRTRAIIPVHLGGWPCEMDELMALAAGHDLVVIEDCAQAHGARYRDRPVGGIGHAGAFSFCQDKIITTGGEGGMVVTNDAEAWSRAWAYKDHGKSYETVYHREHPPGFRWLHESFGTNWRMTEMQAVLGRRQLARLSTMVGSRRRHAEMLNRAFAELPALRITRPPEHVLHSYYKYYTFVRPEALKSGWSRDRIMQSVSERGVPCYSGSCSEIYREVAFQEAGLGPVGRLPVARELGETSLMLLVHPTLSDAAIDRTIATVRAVVSEATRRAPRTGEEKASGEKASGEKARRRPLRPDSPAT
jgi:dTDP-4-amino-4,6-dideoxygalactose transaminase